MPNEWEATYHIRVSHLPFERASEREARKDENDGKDEIERASDISQNLSSIGEAIILGPIDGIVIEKRVPHGAHDYRDNDKKEDGGADDPVHNKLPCLSSVRVPFGPPVIYDQL